MNKTLVVGATTLTLLFGGTGVATASTFEAPSSTTTTLAQSQEAPEDDGGDNGLWGLAGLLGLVGLVGLKRRKDADYPALQSAYRGVQLTNLDGSGFLRGDWAEIVGETGNPAYSPTNTFLYDRSEDEFEQVMAYYWITEAQKYIHLINQQRPGEK